MKLMNDVSRCDGRIDLVDGNENLWHECWQCARRTSPRPAFVWMMTAPKVMPCADKIEVKYATN